MKVYPSRKNLKVAPYAPTEQRRGGTVEGKVAEGIPKLTGESRDIILPTKQRVTSDTSKLKANQCEVDSPLKMEKKSGVHSCTSEDANEAYVADARPAKQKSAGPSIIHSLFKKGP